MEVVEELTLTECGVDLLVAHLVDVDYCLASKSFRHHVVPFDANASQRSTT